MSRVHAVIEWNVRFLSPPFIGAGPTTADADRATVRDSDGNPIIPGSSVKGRLRHHCERIARALKVACCEGPQADMMCPNYYFRSSEDAPTPVAGHEHFFCPICLIFGSPWLASPLHFSDWYCAADDGLDTETWDVLDKTALRTGIGMNRYTRTVQDQRLFVTRTVAPALPAVFKGRAQGFLPADLGLEALLYAGVLDVCRIGGGNSRGLGWIDRSDGERPKVSVGEKGSEQPMDRDTLRAGLEKLQEVFGTQNSSDGGDAE